MDFLWLTLLGAVFGMLNCIAIPMARFIQRVDSDDGCAEQACRGKCVAWRKKSGSKFSFLEQWMLLGYLNVKKNCPKAIDEGRSYRMVCFLVSVALALITFWSKVLWVEGLLFLIVAEMLLFLTIIDWNTQYIPLECNIIIFLCGLIHLFADFSNWVDYIIGLFAVSGFLLLIDKIYTPFLKKKYEGELVVDHVIGDGDIKLMAATGLLLGWKLNFFALGISCVIGSIIHLILMKIKGSERQFAFGPYLSLGIYITMICGEQLVSWYLNLMGVKPL